MLSAERKKTLKVLCKTLNIKQKTSELLDIALTHASYLNETGKEGENYERLEFLGDSAVRLVISGYLFDKYPDFPEGKLSKLRSFLVSDNDFAGIGLKLNINEYINIGKHEEKDGGRTKESVLACVLEAIFGAVYKSEGYASVKNLISSLYDNEYLDAEEILKTYNSKEKLQEYTQALNKDLPEYKLTGETGKSHNKVYETTVYYHGKALGKGMGKTKKDSEKAAAADAMKKIQKKEGKK